jgi:glycerophosphoryl diester phosphodiesterase
MTLAELEQYNFGYYFENKDGQRIYKDATDLEAMGLQIATVDKLFAEFYESHPDLLFIVEIKNEGEKGYEACRILHETLNQYPGYKEQIVVGTFHDEIETELKEKYPELLRGAPTGTAASFVITQYLGVNIFDQGDFACLQIPLSYDVGVEVPLDQKTLIDRAHRRNIAVQYWTINDADEMRRLIELGCDAIMTDDPVLLKAVLEEYK